MYNGRSSKQHTRYDSPLNSQRSDIGKPPSGRLQPLSGPSKYNSSDYGLSSSIKESKYDAFSSSNRPTKNLPAITYPMGKPSFTSNTNNNNNNDSDDSLTDKYNSKFAKKSPYESDLKEKNLKFYNIHYFH